MKTLKINKFIKNIIIIFSFIILSILFLFNIMYKSAVINSAENVLNQYLKLHEIIYIIIGSIILILFLWLFSKNKINKRYLIIGLLVLYAILSFKWINYNNIVPVDDSKEVNNAAISIVNNGFQSLRNNAYIEKYPHQLGMILSFSLIYKIFSTTNYELIQYLNVVANLLTIYGLYLIINLICQKKEKKFVSIIYFTLILTFVPLALLSTFVYGDYIGLALAVYAIYFIIKYQKNNNWWNLFLSGILLSFSYIIKSNYLIFILAIAIYMFLNILKNKKKYLINSILFIIYLTIAILPNTLIKTIGVNILNYRQEEALHNITYICMGMYESSREAGWYGYVMNDAWENTPSSDIKYKKLIKSRVKYLIKHPLYSINFYSRKMVSGWINPYFQSIWYNVSIENKDLKMNNIFNSRKYKYVGIYLKTLIFIIFGGSLFYLITFRKKLNNEVILLYVIFLGGFAFHTIWEMKARYTLPYIVILMPVASFGVYNLSQKIAEKFQLKNSKGK